ncbi:Raftlin-2 [Ameca splendens]|uniref:Raftlin-2 n=2 Tax=Goodeidae TaxID=28758 RepID=A0ABU7BDR8_9TELE|nr:Raftlin-2 [Ataeniobius toweri]
MGCGLRKLEDPEDSSPGKIYSTLKRPQVETKTDTVYDYVLLDFSLEVAHSLRAHKDAHSFTHLPMKLNETPSLRH